MKKLITLLIYLLIITSVVFAQNNNPTVDNVTFSQRTDGSFIVDVYYDVNDADGNAMEVSMQVSDDSGVTFNLSCMKTTGDVGKGITNGIGRHIIWDFGSEHSEYYSNQIRIKIIANDGVIDCPAEVNYSGKIYQTILIGRQCWLKENLDVGSIIDHFSNPSNNGIIEKYCYDSDPLNCDKYGGLYKWNEAMQYTTEESARGICPQYWHIPTYIELQTLRDSVHRDGTALKAVGQGTEAGAGTNSSGFSAILAGYMFYNGSFSYLGDNAYFWSSKEQSTDNTYNMYLNSYGIDAYFHYFSKTNAYSIRCLMDEGAPTSENQPPNAPSSPLPTNNAVDVDTSTTLSWNCNDPDGDSLTYDIYFGTSMNPPLIESGKVGTTYSVNSLKKDLTYYWKIKAKDNNGGETVGPVWSFTTKSAAVLMGEPCPDIPTVTYSGKVYNTVQIGSQCWLKENLNIGDRINAIVTMSNNNILEKYCYEDIEANCDIYGGLYQWKEVMQYVTTEGTKGICPNGWHIPTKTEQELLVSTVGGDGNSLKAIGQGYGLGTGTNISGFSALLAGSSGTEVVNYFYGLGSGADFWNSSVDISGGNGGSMSFWFNADVAFNFLSKDHGFSIRCIKD